MFSGCRQSLIWWLSRNVDVILKAKKKKKKKKKKERKEKRTELLSYWRLGLLEAMDYFENQHIKMNFLPAIMGKDDRFKNVIFLKYIHTEVDPCSI